MESAHPSHSISSFSFLIIFLGISLLLLRRSHAKLQSYDFVVQETTVRRLCYTRNIITVNGMFPGPTIEVNNGDTLVVNVLNRARYNVTLHWHGVRQLRSGWADGPEFVTQCPIKPGGRYTYRFTIEGQEGTLWWHAHSSWLRATVYGALIIRPRDGPDAYPFPFDNEAQPILIGEWWNRNPIDVINEATRTGAAPNISDAFTINGQPGDLYPCSCRSTTVVPVTSGGTTLLRFINSALNNELYVSIAGHTMTVVTADASYTKPFDTSVLMIAPGQTTDVIVSADQQEGLYYIAARAYATASGVAFDNTTTTAILRYDAIGYATKPKLPFLPAFNDTRPAVAFSASLKSPEPVQLPSPVDENLFFTVGVNLIQCSVKQTCGGPNNTRFAASINNVSFVLPTTYSILQAHTFGVNGVFSDGFPASPPVEFDFTAKNINRGLWAPSHATKVYRLRYGSVVQIVLQGTNIFAGEDHPIHLHGYDFYVLATGFGNYNGEEDEGKFNLVDPPVRNTVAVPVNGWAVIRFVADNPGAWLMHCHLDVHITWGLAMVFLVEDGFGEMQALQAPPEDLPLC